MAVANGCQRFHAKEKSIEKRAGPHLGDGVWVQHVQRSKSKIDNEVDAENKTGESRPAQVRIKWYVSRQSNFSALSLTNSNCPYRTRMWRDLLLITNQIREACGNAPFSARFHTTRCACSEARYYRRPNPHRVGAPGVPDRATAVNLYERDLLAGTLKGFKSGRSLTITDARRELRGFILVCCGCKEAGLPCQGDVLLRYTNA